MECTINGRQIASNSDTEMGVTIFQRIVMLLCALAAAAVLGMMLITIADITMHNLLRRPIPGTFDLVELLLVVVVFFGLAEVFLSESNITVDVIDHFINSRARRSLSAVALVITFGFLVLLAYAMMGAAVDTVSFPEHKQETGFPTWLYWIPILFGTAMALLATVVAGVAKFRSLARAE